MRKKKPNNNNNYCVFFSSNVDAVVDVDAEKRNFTLHSRMFVESENYNRRLIFTSEQFPLKVINTDHNYKVN